MMVTEPVREKYFFIRSSVMKFVYLFFESIALAILCSCTVFNTNQTHPDSSAPDVGKDWQIIEQPPQLSNERGRLPFQMEQSVQPGVAKSLPPAEKRMIETPLLPNTTLYEKRKVESGPPVPEE